MLHQHSDHYAFSPSCEVVNDLGSPKLLLAARQEIASVTAIDRRS